MIRYSIDKSQALMMMFYFDDLFRYFTRKPAFIISMLREFYKMQIVLQSNSNFAGLGNVAMVYDYLCFFNLSEQSVKQVGGQGRQFQ